MTLETKKLFYAAKSIDPNFTAKTIEETLDNAGIV